MSEIQTTFNFDPRKRRKPTSKFSDFIVYVDESGDHGLDAVDEEYPVFVLAFCIFYKNHYSDVIVPKLQRLKFDYFGHDLVILHEREIRKEEGDFNIFNGKSESSEFIDALHEIISESNFILASCVIDKRKVQPGLVTNLYHVALSYCLESLYDFVCEKNQQTLETHVVVERRGEKEDDELELEFRRICDGNNKLQTPFPFKIRMAKKSSNSAGLQLADLVARPVGRHFLKPQQNNRAFEVLKSKFYCEGGREKLGQKYSGWGLKIFPKS